MSAENGQLDCRTFLGRLSRFADGDVTPEESEQSSCHMNVCPRCQAAFEAHERLILLLESSKEKEPPWDLDFKVLEAVGFGGARTQLRGYRVSPPLVWAATALGLVVVGWVGLMVGRGVVRLAASLFGPSGSLSAEEMAGLTSRLTRYLVTVWESLAAGLGGLEPLGRSLGAVSDAAKGNPAAIGTCLGTLALVVLFFRIMMKERRSHVRNLHGKGIRKPAGS